MTRNASFVRKIVYISVMAVLLIPLSYLSQPSGLDASKHPGGKLDQMRRQNNLSQSSLGEVDPTSETMKLATLGMRGVATTILWQQAHEHKKKENWDAFAAVLRQISKLQPHFIQVWIFQAWNQSYNVSVEFDNYEHRYHWVKKGIHYLIEGTRYNQRDVRLQWQLGWVFGHKIGRSDERRQFRRLFKEDTDFHEELPLDYNDPQVTVRDFQGKIDNWLVAREFFERAIRIAESPGGSKKWGQSPVLFYSEPTMQRMNYAETILEEGYFGPQANLAWKKSGEEWHEYGNRQIPTSVPAIQIRLNGLDETNARIDEIKRQLDELLAQLDKDLREVIRQEKYDELTEEERAAYETPEEQRTNEQAALAAAVERKLEVSYDEILERAPQDVKEEGARLTIQLSDLQRRASFIRSYRNIVNYEYWATRCEAEQTETMVNARRDVHHAAELYDKAILTKYTDPVTGEEKLGAKEVYERAWKGWAEIFKRYPVMLDNPETEDLLVHIKDYRDLLGQLEQDLPDDFDLQIVLDIFDTLGQRRADSTELAAAWAKRMRERDDHPADKTENADNTENGEGNAKEPKSDDPRSAVPSPPRVPNQEAPEADETGASKNEESQDPRSAEPRPPLPNTDAKHRSG